MVVLHAEAAGLGDGLQLVVRQGRELATGDTKCVEELIVGIVHPIDAEDGFEAALVEGPVVGHKGQTLYQRLYLCPDFGEDGGIFCVSPDESTISPLRTITTPTEQTELRSLLAVSKSIAANSFLSPFTSI